MIQTQSLGWPLPKKKKKRKITSVVKVVEKNGTPTPTGKNVKWCNCCGNQFGVFSKS